MSTFAATACPHDCPSTCALEVEVLGRDRIGKVRGAADNSYTAGVICAKVARYAERVHHPDRLTVPLRRTGAKGGGQWREIGWDEALDYLGEKVETEALVVVIDEYADLVQVGSRNMQNFTLLDEVGRADMPVLLKRGMAATIDEFLHAAEYILSQGNDRVMLCERGIRTYEPATRNTLDLNAVPLLKRRTHLPVIVDPSHGTGQAWMVPHLARAAVAVGADGLLVEVHPDPAAALSDGDQSLTPDQFEQMMETLRPVARSVGRHILEHGSAVDAPTPVHT